MIRRRRLQRPGLGRRGALSVYLIVSLPALLLAVLLGINAGYLVEGRTTLQNSADAAALAAAQGLVDDRTLLDDPALMRQVIEDARQAAISYADANPALGLPVALEPNLENDPDGDIVFGALEAPRDRHLVLTDLGAPCEEFLKLTNTVRVTARRTEERGNPIKIVGGPFLSVLPTDAVIPATATLDRRLVGFRPAGRIPVPLVPIALLSDPTGRNRDSWEFQVEQHGGGDHWRFDRTLYQAVRDDKGDGLFEMAVKLGRAPGRGDQHGKKDDEDRKSNACLLLFGAGDLPDVARQFRSGLTEQDLAQLGGELRLGVDNKEAAVPGVPWAPGSAESQVLLQCLEELRLAGTPRVWPLFTGLHPDSGMPVLSGFVAARVVDVESGQAGSSLSFKVQPCAMSTVTALTDSGRDGKGGAMPNRYICKVRLVE
jgi:Flp pilus assembly protein TadG